MHASPQRLRWERSRGECRQRSERPSLDLEIYPHPSGDLSIHQGEQILLFQFLVLFYGAQRLVFPSRSQVQFCLWGYLRHPLLWWQGPSGLLLQSIYKYFMKKDYNQEEEERKEKRTRLSNIRIEKFQDQEPYSSGIEEPSGRYDEIGELSFIIVSLSSLRLQIFLNLFHFLVQSTRWSF